MKILIFGNGFVASHFKEFYGDEAMITESRVNDYSALKGELETQKPDVVINCIGKTGRPNVDWCEDHKMETLFGNVTVPYLLAQACEELGIYFVQIGSGCVYSGDNDGKGFSEDDAPNFFGSFYSRTKASMEGMLKDFPVLQLRLRMPLDGKPGPRNFVSKIVKYEKVISVPNSISVMDDFLSAADQLIKKRATGIYNMTNDGAIDHAEILDMYKEIVDPGYDYELFSVEEMHKITKAKRSNCELSVAKLKAEGIVMRPVREAVRDALEQYKKNMV
jgi:dTDP-4-dehydrorhamnose reductase